MQVKVKDTHFISNNGGVSEQIDIFTEHGTLKEEEISQLLSMSAHYHSFVAPAPRNTGLANWLCRLGILLRFSFGLH